MDNAHQIKSLEDKNAKLNFDLTALQQDLKENNDKIKEIESKLQTPYSLGVNLFMIILSIAITGSVVFFLLKWWISTGFSVFVGLLLFPVAILSLTWDIFAIATSTRKSHNKKIAEHQNKLTTLLREKEEAIAKLHAIENEIKETTNAINDIKLLQIKEEDEKKRKFEEEEQERKAKLEDRFQKIISSEKIDRDELKSIADLGHIKAKVEMAKLLIDDYCSDEYTAEEKVELIKNAAEYLEHISDTKDTELEFLWLFSNAMSGRSTDNGLVKKALVRIRELKNSGKLIEKYENLATACISTLVDFIDKKGNFKEEPKTQVTQEVNFDPSKVVCRYFANGICGYKSGSAIIEHCYRDDGTWKVCPYYKRRV